ncbi:MAG: HAMP domain-containing histidine kinase [Acidobacteriota bacterium]|nr:HAMP domain-containing histidine kinase [Acidobacteriota bacterium]
MKLPFRSKSIAFRLISAVLLVELVSSLLVIFLSFGYERHMHFRAFDVMLHGRADSVLGAVQDAGDAADNVMLDQRDLHLPPEDIYEVYDAHGRLLGRSPNWQGSGGAATPQQDGFSRLIINQRHYGVLRLHGSRIVDPGEPGGGTLRQVTIVYGAPVEHVWHAIRGAVEFYAAGSLLLLVVTGPLIAWLLHRGLLPLRQLAALASNLTADAMQFDPPQSARTTPELAPLTHALESALQRLERAFVQQRTFVSDAAHELKTAVAVVKSSLQLLGLRERTAAEYHAGLERCLADSERLEDLVAKMLTLARVEDTAPLPGPLPACDIAACIQQTVTQLQTVADLRGVQTAFAPPPAAVPVPLATDDCLLVVSNLLLNALQHSPRGSSVELRLTAQGNAVELAVEDHGEGISPDALPHIFERFYRGDPSRARSTGGAGLGLAICKAVVERAGGAIALASEPGKGATVTVSLPKQ